jgi:dihydroorotate dehydrogenase electron transfer subunit
MVDLVDHRRILPGRWRQQYRAPAAAAPARAGQYIHLIVDDGVGPPLRRPFPVEAVDRVAGIVSIVVPERSGAWLARLRPGDPVELHGPFGRPIERDPRSRHLLLIAEDERVAALRLLVEEALADGCQVVVLLGAPTAGEVYPSSLLPDEVEYVVATSDGSLGHHGRVVDLVPHYEAWADLACAAAPRPTLEALARLAAGRRDRLGVAKLGRKRGGGRPDPPGSAAARRKAYLQVVVDQAIGCAAGVCLGCTVAGASGQQLRTCREGPAFGTEELDWEVAW